MELLSKTTFGEGTVSVLLENTRQNWRHRERAALQGRVTRLH
jgi:hypothetical protein